MIQLTHEQIAKRAYEVYLRSGSLPGRDEENWLIAEAELKKELEAAAAKSSVKPAVQPPARVTAPQSKPLPPERKSKSRW